jgi:predicted Zn-dependent protease with MMP-like domain
VSGTDEEELAARIEEAAELLADGDADGALEVAEAVLDEFDDELDALEIKGLALTDLGEFEEALEAFHRIIEVDHNDASAHALVATTLTELGRLDDAKRAAAAALVLDKGLASGLAARAWLHDIAGRAAEADADYAAAAKIDPEGYPVPLRLDEAAFAALVDEAHAALPDEFHAGLTNVAITVHEFPPVEIVRDPDTPISMSALGYFDGPSILDRSADDPTSMLPAHILIFKRNLERACLDLEELEEEIEITLKHEIAHYLGWDEDDVARMGLE